MIIADEPTTALDVSIQAQIINLFLRLRRELAITSLFIPHDLSVVGHLCERVAVMYLGRIVESGPTGQVYDNPRHPYTRALLESLPQLVLEDNRLVAFSAIEGEIPSPLNPPPGCRFHPRCPLATAVCRETAPLLREIATGQTVVCHQA